MPSGLSRLGRVDLTALRESPLQETLFICFIAAMLYLGGTLPCGRFYYENVDGFFGNAVLRVSYEFVYLYLAVFLHAGERVERSIVRLPQLTTARRA